MLLLCDFPQVLCSKLAPLLKFHFKFTKSIYKKTRKHTKPFVLRFPERELITFKKIYLYYVRQTQINQPNFVSLFKPGLPSSVQKQSLKSKKKRVSEKYVHELKCFSKPKRRKYFSVAAFQSVIALKEPKYTFRWNIYNG